MPLEKVSLLLTRAEAWAQNFLIYLASGACPGLRSGVRWNARRIFSDFLRAHQIFVPCKNKRIY